MRDLSLARWQAIVGQQPHAALGLAADLLYVEQRQSGAVEISLVGDEALLSDGTLRRRTR